MNDITLSILYTLAFIVELIPATYVLIANRRAPANVAIALLFTVFAFNSLAISALTGIFSLSQALPWIAVLVATTFMIGPTIYMASVAVLRPGWLRHRLLYFPFYALPVLSTLMVISDATGLTARFGAAPLLYTPPPAGMYVGGAPALGAVTTGVIADGLRLAQIVLPSLALVCPMLVVALRDRRKDKANSRMAWLLFAATVAAGGTQVFLSDILPLSLTSIIANAVYLLAFGYAALRQASFSWSLAALRRSLNDWPVFAKLILVVVTVFLPSLLIITSVSGAIVRQNMTTQIGTSFNALARLQARGIADALRTQVDNLDTLSRSPVLLSTLNLRGQETTGMDSPALRNWLAGEELNWVTSDMTMEEALPGDFSASLSILAEFLTGSPDFIYLQLTDANGGLVSATETPTHFDFSQAGWWRAAYAGGEGRTYISVPLRDPATGRRYVQIAAPVYANDRVTLVGVLMGHYTLDDLIASLAATQVGLGGRTHLFSPNGIFITLSPGAEAAAQPERQIDLDWNDLLTAPVPWRILAYDQVSSIVSWTTIGESLPDSPVETIFWRITVYQPVAEALAGVSAAQQASLVTALVTAAVAFGFTWIFAGFIAQPIASLTSVAERVLEGDLDVRAEMTGSDEVGVLASTFNTMTGRLRDLVANLESQVRSRTADLESQTRKLQAASQVGQGVISILDPDELIRTSVDVIRERFDLYYVGLFLVDAEGEWAVLQAGTGHAGAQMRARGHRIRVGEGMVGWSVRNGRARVAEEAAADIVRLTTPELPDTRSEAAVPMRARGQTIGALSVQSQRSNEFDPTSLNIIQSLADQLGIAIDNANLLRQNRAALQESREALETVRRTYRQVTREAWSDMALKQRWDLVATPSGVSTVDDASPERADTNGTLDMDVPISVRGVNVGVIRLRKPAESGPWSEGETQYISSYVNQLGSALDSARLFRDIQDRSVQLQTSSDVGQAANAVLMLDELLPMAVQLIGERFALYYAGIFLVEKAEDGQAWAVLRAGTGEAGRAQIARNHRLEIGGQSMIGQAIETREPKIAMDVGHEAVRFENPLLPDTRTEMALPLLAAGEAIGALTIQSDRPAAFSLDEITVFQTMANQLATAIQNARLFEQSRLATETAQEQRRIADSLLKSAGRFTQSPGRDEIIRIIVEEIEEQIRPDQINVFEWNESRSAFVLTQRHAPGDPEDDYTLGQAVTGAERPDLWKVYSEVAPEYNPEKRADGFVHEQYRAPLMQANEAIGVVEAFHTARDAHIREEDRAVINGVLQQAAVALRSAAVTIQNSELLAETQKTATNERLLNEIGAQLIQSLDFETILRTAVEEIGQLPHISGVTLTVGELLAQGDAETPNGDEAH